MSAKPDEADLADVLADSHINGREAVPALTGKRPKKRAPKRAATSANGQASLN
jgi:hypothetical protein